MRWTIRKCLMAQKLNLHTWKKFWTASNFFLTFHNFHYWILILKNTLEIKYLINKNILCLSLTILILINSTFLPMYNITIIVFHLGEGHRIRVRSLHQEPKVHGWMRLCHPPDGSTSPKYKLLCFKPT
jgi:hypothetical protein